MYCNFMLLNVNVCRDWLKKVDIDWDRVNEKSNIDMICDEDEIDGHSVLVTVYYEDGKDKAHHQCRKHISCCTSEDFSVDGIPLRKFVDIVNKTGEKMIMMCTEYNGLGRSVMYEFGPTRRYLLSEIMVECNDDQ